ncbi:MAG: hypothetical protein ACTS8S_00595 [Giesbergeria sp.]
MSDTLNNEIGRLAACLNHRHGGTTAALATLVYVTTACSPTTAGRTGSI